MGSGPPDKNYFDPKVLAKFNSLFLKARCVVDGVMVGIHQSRAKGISAEFEEHREYSPGDDLKHMDWKAYGKFDRYFLKEYRETTNLRCYLLMDCSGSMAYCSDSVSKFEYGCILTASLAYLMLSQQDSVALVAFTGEEQKMVPPKARRGHLRAILEELEGRGPGGGTAVGRVLQELSLSLKRRGMVILISDLLDEPEEVLKGLKFLKHKGNDVLVFHLLDRDELDFPFGELTLFLDLEEELKLLTDPDAVRRAYLSTLKEMLDGYRSECSLNSIDYVLFTTDTPLNKALVRYLSWRGKGASHL